MNFKQKAKTIYKVIIKVLRFPKSALLVLKDESEYEKYLKKKYKKTLFPTVSIDEFLINGKGSINNFTFLGGSSLVTDLVLLKSIAQSIPLCDYLEIGMWRGESIVNVSEVAKSCTSINLSVDEIMSIGFPEKYARLHGCLIKDHSNIKIVSANSMSFDFSSLNQKYDLIFVDGDHSYTGVMSDTKNVFKLLKNEDSVIVWHDYGYDPETPRYSLIAAILDGMPPTEHQYLYHVSNTMCAIYTKRKLKANILECPVAPDKVFQITLETVKFTPDCLQ